MFDACMHVCLRDKVANEALSLLWKIPPDEATSLVYLYHIIMKSLWYQLYNFMMEFLQHCLYSEQNFSETVYTKGWWSLISIVLSASKFILWYYLNRWLVIFLNGEIPLLPWDIELSAVLSMQYNDETSFIESKQKANNPSFLISFFLTLKEIIEMENRIFLRQVYSIV